MIHGYKAVPAGEKLYEGTNVSWMKRDRPSTFVRWYLNRDGDWRAETLTATYDGCTDTHWAVKIGGDVRELSRDEWQECRP